MVCYGDYNETGENNYMINTHYYSEIITDSNNVFVYNKYTIKAGETELILSIPLYIDVLLKDVEILIGQCYYVNGSYNFLAETYISDVKCEVSYGDIS